MPQSIHTIVPENQAQPKRVNAMRELLGRAFPADTPIRALEIGVWYGTGSTQLWLDNLPTGSDLVLLDSWRPYASTADVSGPELRPTYWDYAKMDSLSTDAFLSAFLNVRRFENECPERRINVSMIRAKAATLLPNSSFDFIYIDADHKYDSVKQDIVQAKRLIDRRNGVVCGDDLEKLPPPELIELARQHPDRDYLKGSYGYHPGVCLAVAEEFPAVNMVDGFWWIEYRDGELVPASSMPSAA